MEFTQIRGGLFGYSKKSVCQYISELNALHGTELAAGKEAADKATLEYEERIVKLEQANAVLTEEKSDLYAKIAELTEEISALKASLEKIEEEKQSMQKLFVEEKEAMQAKCTEMEAENQHYRESSDVISTAIINAEKCAATMISDADVRVKEMIEDAQTKVSDEAKRLETAKTYIAEVRSAVEAALKKIDEELSDVEGDIDRKSEDIYSEDKKTGVREKFGNLFKKA